MCAGNDPFTKVSHISESRFINKIQSFKIEIMFLTNIELCESFGHNRGSKNPEINLASSATKRS